MAKLQLNKSSLARESRSLRTFLRFLPSLDLKRQQLMAARTSAALALKETLERIETLRAEVGRDLPMLSNRDVELTHLVRVASIELGSENLLGARLPTLQRVELEARPYGLLAKPHWVDNVVARLGEMLHLRVRAQVQERRLSLLDASLRTITQRVNLFDKVLIPRTRSNIKRIKIHLSDKEMAAVVRSKIAKRKHVETGSP